MLGIFLVNLGFAAPELTFQNENIQPGETVLGEINVVGNFEEEISKSDISFFKSRKEVFFEYDLLFKNDTYYFYFYAVNEGEYKIVVNDVLYKDANGLGEATLEKEFNVSREVFIEEGEDGNDTAVSKVLSIKPGFLFTLDVPSFKISNKGNVTFNFTYGENEIELRPLEVYDVEYLPTEEFSFLEIFSYKDFLIPVIYPIANGNDTWQIPKKVELKFSPESLEVNLVSGEESQVTVELYNFGETNVTNISFSSDLDGLEVSDLKIVEAKNFVNLTLVISSEMEGHFDKQINLSYIQNESFFEIILPVSLFVYPEGTNETEFEILEETCSEKGGAVCNSSSVCSGDSAFTKGGDYCCFGDCEFVEIKDPDEKGSGGTWIGIIIFVVLGVVGFLIWKKGKKTKPKTSNETLKEVDKNYSKRISGGLQRN